MPDLKSELIERGKAKQAANYLRIDERCSKDCYYWLTTHTATVDPHAESGQDTRRPFPKQAWIKLALFFFGQWDRWPRQMMPKSRQVMASWTVAGFITWLAQWRPDTQILVQTETEKKAQRLVQYCKSLYSGQALFMRKMHPLRAGYTDIRISKDSALELVWANGSEVIGIPSGASGIASYHPTVFVEDESGLLPDAEGSFQIAHPVCKLIICLGSARPGWWADMCGETSIDKEATDKLIEELNGDQAFQDLLQVQV